MYEPLCHQQPYYAQQPQYAIRLPKAESVVGRLINLPTHMGVDEEGARLIARTLSAVVRELAAV
jgi:dTDP-4-amino-4,6-dideoxygalactose transaminase